MILIADRFLRDSIPKDDLKSVLETRVALLCYGSSVIDDDVKNVSPVSYTHLTLPTKRIV